MPGRTLPTSQRQLNRTACRGVVTRQPSTLEVDEVAGTIRGVSVISAGLAVPANAPPFMVDATTLEQVAACINRAAAAGQPLRVRVTHPELNPNEDGISWTVGQMVEGVVDGDRVRGTVVLGTYAASTPNGNLRTFLLGMAKEHPTNAGLSVIIQRGHYEPGGADGTPVARVAELWSVDFVGEPGANTAGMLSGGTFPPLGGERQSGVAPGGSVPMEYNDAQWEYLHGLGLAEDADEATVAAFVAGLTDEQRAHLASLAVAAGGGGAGGSGGGGGGGATGANAGPGNVAARSAASNRTAAAAGGIDRQYLQELRQIGELGDMPAGWAVERALSGITLAAARDEAIAARRARTGTLSMGATSNGHVRVGGDRNLETLRDGIRDAILLRAGNRVERPHPRSEDFRHLRVLEMARAFLCASGLPAQGWAPLRIARCALNSQQFHGERQRVALTAGDYSSFLGTFTNLLADTAGQSLQMAYKNAPVAWPKFCTRGMASDFRQQDLVQLGAVGAMTATTPGDIVAYASLTDAKEVYSLTTYTSGATLTMQQLVNDQLGAFGRLPQSFAVGARQKEDALAFSVLSTNAAMGDSVALFHASHANLAASGAVMSVATLQAGIAAMKAQTALGGTDPLDIVPGVIICPATLAATAKQLVYGAVDPGSSGAAYNPHVDQFVVVDSARLTGTAWYLAAKPGELVETIQVCFLDGTEAPEFSTEEDFDSNVLKLKCVHNLAAKAADHRGLYKNPGA